MNNLRAPLILLFVALAALVGWFVWAHEQTETTMQLQATASTSAASVTQAYATTSARNYPGMNYPSEDVVASNIAGTWQSTDDPNYSIGVTSNGKWTDSYQGADASSATSETGTYELFTSQNPDKDFTGTMVPGVTYLKVSEGSSTLFYSVIEADGSNLQLGYLARGNTLSFVKTQ